MGRLKHCKICGRVVKTRYRSGRCLNCAMNKINAVNRSLRKRKGKYFKRWKNNILEGIKKL